VTEATDVLLTSDDESGLGPAGYRLAGCPFGLGLERNCLELPVLLEKEFHLPLGLFQFLAARRGKLHSLFEQGQRLFQGRIAFLQLLHDPFEALEALFELRQVGLLLRLF